MRIQCFHTIPGALQCRRVFFRSRKGSGRWCVGRRKNRQGRCDLGQVREFREVHEVRGATTATLLLCVSAILCLSPTLSTADDHETPQETVAESIQDSDPSPLNKIIIEGSRQTQASRLVGRSGNATADLTGFTETVYTEESWRGVSSVGELLDRSVGVQVRHSGGREDFQTLSVRGSRAGQVRVLVDGVSLSRAQDQTVDLSSIPLESVERIEIYRGFTPIGFATSGAASVVNIITRPAQLTTAVALSYGSYDSVRAVLRSGTELAGGTGSLSVAYRGSQGDFEFVDDHGTDENLPDDRVRRRNNNDSDAVDAALRFRRALKDGSSLALHNNTFFKDEGVPNQEPFLLSGPTPSRGLTPNLTTVRNISGLSWNSADGQTGAEANVTVLDQDLDDDPDLDDDRIRNRTVSAGLRGRRSRSVAGRHFVDSSVEIGHEDFRGDSPTQRRSTLSLALGDEIALGANWALALQLRHEQLWNRFQGDDRTRLPSSHDSSTDPRIGLYWNPHPSFTLRANAGTYFRPPNFSEQFGVDGFSSGNPELRPETGRNMDAGFSVTGTRLGVNAEFQYAYFDNDSDDLIVLVLDSFRRSKAMNVDAARVRGHEARAELRRGLNADGPRWARGLSASFNYTYQDARNRSGRTVEDGLRLPGIPPQEAYARVAVERPQWILAYELQFQDAHFLTTQNVATPREHVPDRMQHDVSLTLGPFAHGWEVALELDNLTDTLVPDEYGFPVPGRAAYLTLSYEKASSEPKR